MTFKSIIASEAAVIAIGAAIASVWVSGSCVMPGAQVRLAAVGAPSRPALPQDAPPPAPTPGQNLPTPDQLTGILVSLTDPDVPFANKNDLVEGGITSFSEEEARVADHDLQIAAKNGKLPLEFTMTNIQPGADRSVTADIAFSAPKLPIPVRQTVTFVKPPACSSCWVLSRDSMTELLYAVRH